MANHLHKQIRDALETALTGLATTGANVFANRIVTVPDAKLPCLCIFGDNESATPLSIHAAQLYERELAILIEARAKGANVDDTLDQISKEVEVALSGGFTVGGRHLDLTYTGMEFDDEQADKPAAVKRMRFTVTYMAAANAPDVLS